MDSQRFYELARGLDAIVGKQAAPKSRYSVYIDNWRGRAHRTDKPAIPDCPDFVGSLYVFLPGEPERQETVKYWVGAFVALEAKLGKDLMFIVSSGRNCGEECCTGHYQDPLESAVETELLLHDRFPQELNGTYIYFIEREKFKKFFEKKKK